MLIQNRLPLYQGMYIVERTDRKSWSDAHDACAAAGGHLMTVNTMVDLEAGRTRMTTLLSDPLFWIGGSDLLTEGVFTWHSGDPLDIQGICFLYLNNTILIHIYLFIYKHIVLH